MSEAIAARRVPPAAFFGAVAVAIFAPGLFLGQVPAYRDLLVLMIPLRWQAREAVRALTLPTWSDGVFFGAPFLANYQSAVLYPPSLLVYALPFPAGFSAFLAFHLAIAGWGMARYLERCRALAPGAALFGGIVFALGGFSFSLVSLTNQFVVACWMPWVIAAAEATVERSSARAVLGLTALVALQALGGAPEALLLTAAVVAALVARTCPAGRRHSSAAIWVVVAYALAAGIVAVQLLPTGEYAATTERSEGLGYASVVAESLAPRSLLQLVVPHTFEHGAPGFVPEGTIPLVWSLYAGIVPLALAAASLPASGVWGIVLASGVLLALGDQGPLFPALYALAPRLFGAFRFPIKFFLVAHCAIAVLAAQGLDATLRDGAGRRPALAWIGIVLSIAGLVSLFGPASPNALLAGFGYHLPLQVGDDARRLLAENLGRVAFRGVLFGSAGLAVLWLSSSGRIGARSLAGLIAALTVIDLVSLHEPTLAFTDWRSLREAGAARAGSAAPGERLFHYCTEPGRCLPPDAPGLGPWSGSLRPGENAADQARTLWAALAPDAPVLYGLGAVAGSDGFSTSDQRELFRALAMLPRDRAVHLLASLGVSRLIGPTPLGAISGLYPTPAETGSSAFDAALVDAAPRSYVAERAFAAESVAGALARAAEPDFRPGRDAMVAGSGHSIEEAAPGRIDDLATGPGWVRATLELPSDTLWVVGGTWFPGWEGSVDGQPTEIVRVNGILRGMHVPRGHHRVEMRYRPRSLAIGAQISVLSLVLLFGGGAVAAARGRWK